MWLPEGAGPVPAILEYLPYRLSDGTQAGDHQQMGWFAGHGYAGVRVDIRGTGNSGGIIEDEYSEQEQLDGLEVIAWLAAQPWCDGQGRHGRHVVERVQRPPARRAHAAGARRGGQLSTRATTATPTTCTTAAGS